jgi:hypothetical protein
MIYVKITSQAPGSWAIGATVRKVNGRPNDRHPDGTLGRICGSLDVREARKAAAYLYCVIWPDDPDKPVFVADTHDDGTPRLELVP